MTLQRKYLCSWLTFMGLLFGCNIPAKAAVSDIIVTNDLSLEWGAHLEARLIIRANHITINGNGAVLAGDGQIGDLKSFENAGVGILIEGVKGVTISNLQVRGFATGLLIRRSEAIKVNNSDFSDNYHNPKHGWGELPPRGGILCEFVRHSVIEKSRACRVWDGLHLIDSDDNLIIDNDFSHCSNTATKLWKSCRNKFLNNNLSYGIRIDRTAGEVHARDSTCVLIETGSNDNYWFRNDITHGGDGIFIRPLNRWISTGNVFVENDTSHANNNCVESWSPGNTFIRNRANHGSYGFWLGGSDQTVLLGNEAAYNGMTNGNHNAPEAGFHHGGIVIVGGPSSHTIIDGNHVHDNNGAGIAFRGDTATQGRQWQTEHWIIQRNRIENNRFGIWGRWGAAFFVLGNILRNNGQNYAVTNTTGWDPQTVPFITAETPKALLTGPEIASIGQKVRFDASNSFDLDKSALHYDWWIAGKHLGQQSTLEHIFHSPGFYRVGLTVNNGSFADLAWRHLLVIDPSIKELGTEDEASHWGFELENNSEGKGRIVFENDQSLIGKRCLKLTPNPYPGDYATAIYPAKRDANWNFTGKKQIRFWMKSLNPNIPGYQNAGPVIRLLGAKGQLELKPAKDANLLNDPPFSEARWLWMPITAPVSGNEHWQIKITGEFNLSSVSALSLSFDSYGWDPFTIWLDGLTME